MTRFSLSDNFSPAASTSWSNSTGSWTVLGGQYFAQQANNDPPAVTELPFLFTNSGLTLTTTVNSLADSGIVFDAGTGNNLVLILGGNGYGQGEQAGGAGNSIYWCMNVLSLTSLLTGTAFNQTTGVFTPGLNYTLSVVANNGVFSVYNDVDGTLDAKSVMISSLTDTALTGFRVGLYDDQPNTTTGSGSGTPTSYSAFSVSGNLGGTLPNVSASLTATVSASLQAILASLSPAGSTPNVVAVASTQSPGTPVSGTLNAYVVTTAGGGAALTLPAGFQAGYLLAGATSLTDTIGGAVLIDAAALSTLTGAANDTLFGGNGNATLIATSGAETIYGGTGANLIELGASTALANTLGADTIIGTSGAATVNAGGAALYFGNGGATLFNAFGATATLVGGGAETINAGAASMLVFGGPGALAFNAGSGASTVISGAGGATVTGGSTGTLYFGTGPTSYVAGTAVDTVLGFTGTLTATGGANGTLFFTGTGGANNVSTGAGSSTIIGFGTGDTLTATGSGTDIIAASGASETINGATSTGTNTYFAFGANDSVIGGAGTTAIESGLGNHTLVAGSGTTLFEILAGTLNRAITIGNFVAGQDFVQLQGYAAGAGAAALQTAALAGGSEVLTLSDGTKLTFQGVTGLGAGSFV